MHLTSQLRNTLALAALGCLACAPGALAQITINFDVDANGVPINAPANFISTTPLRDLYASLGVHFSGPGLNDGGGAILNQEAGFGVNARSGTNFLAFNPSTSYTSGGVVSDPETLTFDTLMSKVSIFASPGGNTIGTFTLQAFDSSNLLVGTSTVTPDNETYGQLSITASDIRKVVLTNTGSEAFVYDDLTFQQGVSSVPEPGIYALLATSGLTGAGFLIRKRRRK